VEEEDAKGQYVRRKRGGRAALVLNLGGGGKAATEGPGRSKRSVTEGTSFIKEAEREKIKGTRQGGKRLSHKKMFPKGRKEEGEERWFAGRWVQRQLSLHVG